ncbi:hypothetical protein ALMA_0953 [Alloscardovia macacae]|uniref:Uncharacterized protein n=1 Tax=Alloscardovia macacae TaxID=1160091 RepID=A0A261F5T1_9BIFI|nr:hypothetical protein ALMA_0953 [Alloscardovia macacae]
MVNPQPRQILGGSDCPKSQNGLFWAEMTTGMVILAQKDMESISSPRFVREWLEFDQTKRLLRTNDYDVRGSTYFWAEMTTFTVIFAQKPSITALYHAE